MQTKLTNDVDENIYDDDKDDDDDVHEQANLTWRPCAVIQDNSWVQCI